MSKFDYNKEKKKICFSSIHKTHVELKLRLNYDRIKIKDFFNEIINGYLEENEHIMKYIDHIQEKNNLLSKIKKKKREKIRQNKSEVIKQFGLNQEDIENIFDILEKDFLQ